MSEILQPAVHLDPDTLSAFAENALPPHERQAAFEHLAVCAHCRELAQLALPPMEEMQPIAVVAPRRGWRWLVLGAAACAGIGLASIALLHPHPQPAPSVTTARAAAPPPPATAEPNNPTAASQAPRAKAPEPRRPRPAQVTPPPALVPPPAPIAQASGAAASPGVQTPLPQVARSAAAPQPYLQETAPAPPTSAASVRLGVPAKPAIPNALPPATAGAGSASGGILAAQNGFQAQALPSHLPIASRFAQGQLTIAADTAGTLFASQDAGLHWSAVPAPWAGRVVRVDAAVPPAAPRQYALRKVAPAAGNASLQGTVLDPSGAVIAGATIIANGLRTTADRNGEFHFQALAPGPCDLRAEAPGFNPTQLTLTLADAQHRVQNLTLQAGASTETITVTADSATISNKLSQTLSIFALTTSTGERWVSPDGTHWHRD